VREGFLSGSVGVPGTGVSAFAVEPAASGSLQTDSDEFMSPALEFARLGI